MKRKGLRLLALAVPLIGLGLIWRAGQRARDEADVREVALRNSLAAYAGQAPQAFISFNRQDPPMTFIQRFSSSTPKVLVASLLTPNPGNTQKDQFATTIMMPHHALVLDIQGVQWIDNDNANVQIRVTHSDLGPDIQPTNGVLTENIRDFLKRQDGRWTIAHQITAYS